MFRIIPKFRGFLRLAFPASAVEWGLFLFYMLIYGGVGYYISMGYTLIFDNRIPWDAYFSLDNRAIVMTGGGFERHPLSNYFFDILRNAALWFSDGKFDAKFRWALACFSALATTFSVLYVFKYLHIIIKLKLLQALLLSIFFSLFSTTIILSFTPETYTYSQPLILLFLLYTSQQLFYNKRISGLAITLGTVAIGGLTITNAAKVFVPVLFEKQLSKNFKNLLHAFMRGLIAVSIFILLFLNRLNFEYEKIITKTGEQYEKFSQPKITPLWDMVISWFIGGNMLSPSFIIRDYHNKKGFEYKAIFMDTYSSFFTYFWVASVLICIVWAFVQQRKNKLFLLLLSFFSIDLIIHVFLKFGLHTAYVYGGHFIFLIPLFLGWLWSAYSENPKWEKGITTIFILLTVFLVLNNVYRTGEFLEFVQKYYKG